MSNPVDNHPITGKVVVITGASIGLGEATARMLSAYGAVVVLGARRADRLQSLADEITGNGGRALALPIPAYQSGILAFLTLTASVEASKGVK